MTANRAEILLRQLWRQRLVSLLLLAAVVVVAVRQAQLSVQEVFPGGAEIGEAVYELGIGYIAAWIFNLLVVILPRLHDRKLIMPGARKLLSRLCAPGLRAVTLLHLQAEDYRDLAAGVSRATPTAASKIMAAGP